MYLLTLKPKETNDMATSKRGFASMDQAKQREIASKGGRAAHAKGTAHEFTSDEARVAGRKGGEAVSRDRAHMAAIGREGGHSRGARARANSSNLSSSVGSNLDVAQDTSSQPFVRQANDDRNRLESRDRFGSDRSSDRSASDRSDRGDNANDGGALSGRDRI
jgi:uncharacterized protein